MSARRSGGVSWRPGTGTAWPRRSGGSSSVSACCGAARRISSPGRAGDARGFARHLAVVKTVLDRIPFWWVGEFTTSLWLDWDVHWGYRVLTHSHLFLDS